MVGVALPSIQADPGLSTSALQWIVSGYVLGHGGFLLLGRRAADILGRRRVFLTAVAVFALTSLIGGPVGDGNRLIVARLLKGVIARVRPTRDVVHHHDHRCGARPGESDDGGGGKEPERGLQRRPPQHLLNTSMQIGGAIGLAIVTAVLTTVLAAVLAAGNKGLSGPDALLAGFTFRHDHRHRPRSHRPAHRPARNAGAPQGDCADGQKRRPTGARQGGREHRVMADRRA